MKQAAVACTQKDSWASLELSFSPARGRLWCIAARFRTRHTLLRSCATSTKSTRGRTGQTWHWRRPNELLTIRVYPRTSGLSTTSWCGTDQTEWDEAINSWSIMCILYITIKQYLIIHIQLFVSILLLSIWIRILFVKVNWYTRTR